MCGIIGIFKHEGNANVELYEGLLMLQHRGQDSAGMVTTDWERFKEYKENGLVKDVFASESVLDKMKGTHLKHQRPSYEGYAPQNIRGHLRLLKAYVD
jgi:amidophosphoribosyltransferase